MKKILIILIVGLLYGCSVKDNNGRNIVSVEPANYSEQTSNMLNDMEAPVILLVKADNIGGYSVTLQDATGEAFYMGNMSTVANGIGQNYNVGDTIKRKVVVTDRMKMTNEELLSSMKSPVILIAKDDFILPVNTVLVKDATGRVEEFGDWAIHELNVGDTIK